MSSINYAVLDDKRYAVHYRSNGEPMSIDIEIPSHKYRPHWREVWNSSREPSPRMLRVIGRAAKRVDGTPATGRRS